MTQVTESLMQEHFTQMFDMAQTVTVTRDGRPLAVILSLQRYSDLTRSRPSAKPSLAADLLAGLDVKRTPMIGITDAF